VVLGVAVVWLASQSNASQTDAYIGGGSMANTSSDPLGAMANAIATMEGFFVSGSLPQRTNNPGDIGTFGGKVRSYPDSSAGFSALQNYIGTHAAAHPDWNFYDFFHYYLTGDPNGTPGPGQNPNGYAEYVAGALGVSAATPISQVLGG